MFPIYHQIYHRQTEKIAIYHRDVNHREMQVEAPKGAWYEKIRHHSYCHIVTTDEG